MCNFDIQWEITSLSLDEWRILVHVEFRLISSNIVINCFTGSYKKDKICYQDFHLPRHFPTVEVSLPRHSYQNITRIECFPTKTFSLFRHFQQILDNVYCTFSLFSPSSCENSSRFLYLLVYHLMIKTTYSPHDQNTFETSFPQIYTIELSLFKWLMFNLNKAGGGANGPQQI